MQRGAHTAWPGAQLWTLSLGMRCEKGAVEGLHQPMACRGQDFQPIQLFVKQQREEIMDLEDC